jgi:ParB-like chromosome segregation protein Spo0J
MTHADRRQRIHELVLALLAQQRDLELLDGDDSGAAAAALGQSAGWLERNRRVVQRYQALVRSAITLDALVDQEVNGGFQKTLNSRPNLADNLNVAAHQQAAPTRRDSPRP